MMNDVYLALGGALFGSIVMGLYNKLMGNGVNAKLARLEERIFFLEKEIEDLKDLIKERCKIEVR